MISAVPLLPTDLVLSAHVAVLTGESNGKYPDGNSMLVQGTHGALVVDPSLTVHRRGGPPTAVDRALVSHAHEDHLAGLAACGAVCVGAHHADLLGLRSLDGFMEVYGLPAEFEAVWRETVSTAFNYAGWPDAEGFADGEVFDLGGVSVRVLHLPGHTRGHSAFLVEPDGVAFVGDVDLSSFGPYYGDHWSDLDEFVASIERVRVLEAAHYVTFHHKGVVEGHAEFVRQLDAFAAVIDRRDDRLLELLDRPRTLAELVDVGIVYRPGTRPDTFGESVERRTIAMHLDRLLARGAAIGDGERFERTR